VIGLCVLLPNPIAASEPTLLSITGHPVYPQTVYSDVFLAEDMGADEKEVYSAYRGEFRPPIPGDALVVEVLPDLLHAYLDSTRVHAGCTNNAANTPDSTLAQNDCAPTLRVHTFDTQRQLEQQVSLETQEINYTGGGNYLQWTGKSKDDDELVLHQKVEPEGNGLFWGQLTTGTGSIYQLVAIPCEPHRYFYFQLPANHTAENSRELPIALLERREHCRSKLSKAEQEDIKERFSGFAEHFAELGDKERNDVMSGPVLRCVDLTLTDSVENWHQTMACEARYEQARYARNFATQKLETTPQSKTPYVQEGTLEIANQNGFVRANLILKRHYLEASVFVAKRQRRADIRAKKIAALIRARQRYSALGAIFVRYHAASRRITMDFTEQAIDAASRDQEVQRVTRPAQWKRQ